MKKTPLIAAFLLSIFLVLYQTVAFGGEIALNLTTSTELVHKAVGGSTTDSAQVKITIRNTGNDTAGKVSIQAQLFDRKYTLPVAVQIPPDKSADASFTMFVPPALNGSYPILLNMLYEHSNGKKVVIPSVALLRTPGKEQSRALTLKLEQGNGTNGNSETLTAHIMAKEAALAEVNLICYTAEDLALEPAQQRVRLNNGKGMATFNISKVKEGDEHYVVYVVAEVELPSGHETFLSATIVPPLPLKGLLERVGRGNWQRIGYGAIILTMLLSLVPAWLRKRAQLPEEPETTVPTGDKKNLQVDILILAACTLFILVNLNPQLLLTQTTATGGDMASHYYTVDYLRHVLLPQGKISGWTMGNYGGFPLLQFYFPLPFLLMCLLDIVLPLQVAFKIVTILGILLLPVGVYFLLRTMRRPFPAPIFGALFTLPFLFHSANSMWGANILSTMAGEFSYSLSFSLSLILLGTLYYGIRHERWVIGNAILVFLIGFSHGYTLLFVEALSLFFLITTEGFIKRFVYLFKVYATGFLLLAFWLVPLLVFTPFTTSYHLTWVINSWREVLPPQILPFAILAVIGSITMLTWSALRVKDSKLVTAVSYLCSGIFVSGLFYIAAPKLGVVDIRYIPYGQVLAGSLAAIFIGWLTRFVPGKNSLRTAAILCMFGIFLWVGGNPGPAASWAKWVYSGFETRPAWPLFKEINTSLKGGIGDPRVMYEHSEDHHAFGSSRAFESLPLFAGRSTLEGLYMQASISAPFIFYLQSEVSAVKSAPFPQYSYTNMDFKQALPHLRLFNVGELIIKSNNAKKAIRETEGYQLKKNIGDYELWEVTANNGHYVEALAFEPVLFPAGQWKRDSYRWFTNEKQLDAHLLFDNDKAARQDKRLKARSGNLSLLPRIPINTTDCWIKETIGNDEINIETNWIGKPLLVKVSYHPNWQVEGADRIYLVSPSFMLIYPNQTTVRLHYGRGWPDRAGAALTLLGLIILLINLPLVGRPRTTLWAKAAKRLHIPASLVPGFHVNLSLKIRKQLLVVVLLAGSLITVWCCYKAYTNDINRLFNKGIQLKDAKRFNEARASFSKVVTEQPLSNISQDSAYYIAICYYLENKNSEAITAFRNLIKNDIRSLWVPEAYYHIGLCQFRLGGQAEGIATMNLVIRDYPNTQWANYAKDRLAEKK